MKTIFITGTSSGLGKAAVRLFHDHGWKVIATMRNTEKGREFNDLERVTVLPLDIADSAQITNTVSQAIALSDIDVVLNNAAYGIVGPLEGVSGEELTKQVDTNLLGAIRITQAFIPHFRNKKSGMFVNITSIAGLVTFPFDSIYHTVKWGLEAFSEAMTYELAPWGISVKTIAPGFIRSAFASNIVLSTTEPYQELFDRYMKVVGGMMDPTTSGLTSEEVAAVVYDAVTDGKNQVHYTAGADAKSMYERRLEAGPEISRQEMSVMFLGQ